MSFLGQLCAQMGSDVAPVRECQGKRSVGRSVASYLRGDVMGRVMDSVAMGRGDARMIEGVACHLTTLSRGVRRDYLTNMSPVVRRRLLDAGVRIRDMVKDSAIDYAPELCWAISDVIDHDGEDGYALLESYGGSLPREVESWFKAFKENRYGAEAQRLGDRLGRYRLVRDDDRLRAYMGGAVDQEESLDNIIDRSVEVASELSDVGREKLEQLYADVEKQASSFLSAMMSTYEEGLSEVVASEVGAISGKIAEEVLDDPTYEEVDVESVVPNEEGVLTPDGEGDGNMGDADPFDMPVDHEDGVGDSRPVAYRAVRDGRKKVFVVRGKDRSSVRDCAGEVVVSAIGEEVAPAASAAPAVQEVVDPAPLVPFAVGSMVQVSYMGNLYRGIVSAAGDGSIIVEGLPFEYFSARNAANAFTGTSADTTFKAEDVSLYEEASEEEVLIPQEAESMAVESESVVADDHADEDSGGVMVGAIEDDADEDGVEDHPEGYDESRAEAFARWRGIDVKDVAYDDGHYGEEGTNKWYVLVEEEDLPSWGLFAAEAEGEEDRFYIYSATDALHGSPYAEEFSAPLALGETLIEDDPQYVGLAKLLMQIDNLQQGFYDIAADVITLFNGRSYEGLTISKSSPHSYRNGRPLDPFVVISDSEDFIYYKSLIDPEFADTTIVVTGASSDEYMDAMRAVVEMFDAYGKASPDVKAQLRQSLRAVLADAAPKDIAEGSVSQSAVDIIASVVEGNDLISEDNSYGITYDEGYVSFITPARTEVVERDNAVSYLLLNADVYGPTLGLSIEGTITEDDASGEAEVSENVRVEADDVVRTREGVTTMEDVDGNVVSTTADVVTYAAASEMWSRMAAVSEEWAREWCFNLSQSPIIDARVDAAKSLADRLDEEGFTTIRIDATIPRLILSNKPFMDIKADGVYVGSSLFTYQTADMGILSFASSVASAMVDLGHKILDREEVSVTTSVSDADDDGEGSVLSEQVKAEVIHKVEAEVERALGKLGLSVKDSAGIAVDAIKDAAPNTFDIPHTASTFHRIRDRKRVMDSVLSVASDALGERLTFSQYKSMMRSSSKKALAKVQKVVDTAVRMGELDLVCPELYKRRLTDTAWVCDSVGAVAKAFKFDLPSVDADSPCEVSLSAFDGDCMNFKAGSDTVYLRLISGESW